MYACQAVLSHHDVEDGSRARSSTLARISESGVHLASPRTVNPAGWARLSWAHTVDLMTTLVANRGAPARRQRRVPWSPHAWGEALYLAGGIPRSSPRRSSALLLFDSH